MIIFPAIDLKEGQCVRLMQGDPDRATVYGNDPAAVARRWRDEGAEWLHVVDLDGAFAKEPRNRGAVADILEAVDIPVQLGGGIRNMETVRAYLDMGVRRVILGTVALVNPEILEEACALYPGRVLLGIDARDGRVAIEGWKETSETTAVDLVERMARFALAGVVYTDIRRDGMQTGVNVEATLQMMRASRLPVIASGGVATLADVEGLLPLAREGLEGVITGRALYTGALSLREALRVAAEWKATRAGK